MSENIKMEDLIEKEDLPSESEPEEKEKEVIEEPEKEPEITPEQDPLKTELDRVQNIVKRTPVEKLLYTKQRVEKQLKELGVEDEGEDEEDLDDEDQPLTVGMYKKIQRESASKTALQLAGEIQNETERELVSYHLNNSIRSTGNAEEDFKLARTLVNAVKNKQIMEEQARKTPAKTHSSSSGSPAKDEEIKGELTPQEKVFLGKPFNMTKEQILKTRTQ
jgi:hypothetical protein